MSYLFGYFSVMIIFMVLAIVFAKFEKSTTAAWVCFFIGAIWQLISLIALQKDANLINSYGGNVNTSRYWIVYIILIAITGILIPYLSYRNSEKTQPTDSAIPNADSVADSSLNPNSVWRCSKCGGENQKVYAKCRHCGEYRY